MTLQIGIVDVNAGENVRIVEPCNLYGCTLGDDCFVGPFVEIQRGVTIGARTRVQSHSFICELVTIGADCFVGHGVMFVNDRFAYGGPARGDRDLWEATIIGSNVSICSAAVWRMNLSGSNVNSPNRSSSIFCGLSYFAPSGAVTRSTLDLRATSHVRVTM